MKIKKGYILRQVADSYMAVPIGREAGRLKGVIALNETGRRIWEELEQETTTEAVTSRLLAEYDIPAEVLLKNVTDFAALLREKDLLE